MTALSVIVLAAVGAMFHPDASAAPAKQNTRQSLLIEGNEKLAARRSYQTHCASCHGAKGDGQSREAGSASATDFTTPKAVVQLDRKRMVAAVRTGHEKTVRARWLNQLDESHSAAVIDYIREAFMLPAPVADASLGRKIYARTCSVCHGERGNAASWAKNSLYPPPFDFSSSDAKKLTRQDMISAVTFGVRSTAMMPFTTQLTKNEIPAVVDYIREAFIYRDSQRVTELPTGKHGTKEGLGTQQHASREPSHRNHGHGHGQGNAPLNTDAVFPAALVGDATRGKALYEKNCAACHGMKGDGKGPQPATPFRSDRKRRQTHRDASLV
jgi:mono/diheme cytochrome c family protein